MSSVLTLCVDIDKRVWASGLGIDLMYIARHRIDSSLGWCCVYLSGSGWCMTSDKPLWHCPDHPAWADINSISTWDTKLKKHCHKNGLPFSKNFCNLWPKRNDHIVWCKIIFKYIPKMDNLYKCRNWGSNFNWKMLNNYSLWQCCVIEVWYSWTRAVCWCLVKYDYVSYGCVKCAQIKDQETRCTVNVGC